MRWLDRLSVPLGHRDDPGVQRECNWARHVVELPAGLAVTWLGTAGFALRYEDTTVLIDPYLSRADLRAVARNRPMPVATELLARVVPGADAILLGHTHFDHALDAPHLARAHDCPVLGSASAVRLLSLHDRPDLAVAVEPYRAYEIGPFTVRFVPSRHSKLLAGLAVPSDGELTCDSLEHLGAGRYRCGQVWGIAVDVAGITLYHQGSADLVDDAVRDRGVDVFLCGIARRMWSPRFVERAIRALDPGLIVAHHHDDFFRPLESPMGFSFNVNLGGFVEDVARVAPGLQVRTLDPLQSVVGDDRSAPALPGATAPRGAAGPDADGPASG